MKFNVSSSELLKAMMNVSKALPSKSPLPILEYFLLVLNGGILEVTASDQEITLKTSVEVDNTEEEGSIAIPAKLTELLKALPDQPISIKTINDRSVECAWATGNSLLPYFPADDYPEIKSVGEDAEAFTIPAQTLIDGISGTVYATADVEFRPAMNGIFFDIDTESTTLVASDSHKLICYTTNDVKASAKSSFILHKKPAVVLKGTLSKDDTDVTVAYDSQTVVFTFGNTTMICRLVVGKYPNYKDVIPKNNANILKIDRVNLLNTLKRVSVCANNGSKHVKFDLQSGQLEISAQDLGFEIAAYEKIICDYQGDELAIGFKSSFLIEILSNMTCETLQMKFSDSHRAALLVPTEEEADTEKIRGILMPIVIS